jgi:hypothetical protein
MTALTVQSVPRQLVALSPHDLPAASAEILQWCQGQIIVLSQELREARENLRETKRRMLGSPKAWQSVVKRTVMRMIYYAKIKAAVRAGYLVIPSFPAEIMAVRVGDAAPRRMVGSYPSQVNQVMADLTLPPGLGRYVDETKPHEDRSYTLPATPQYPGEHVARYVTRSYDEHVDFPVHLVKPIVLEATERAMSLRIFDRIGVVHGKTASRRQIKADPIVVGQIMDGARTYPRDHVISFFIAWWFDPRTL